MAIPAELKTNFQLHQATSFSDVLKPVYGSIKNLFCEFRVHKEYHAGDSKKAGKEVQREVELLLIQTDRFSRVPLKVGDPAKGVSTELEPDVQMETAELYERFKAQKDSTDTLIATWEAVSDQEKGLLMQAGIFTVEQLYKTPEEQRFRLGTGHRDLWERAERHCKTKRENDASESRRELELVMEENRAIRHKQEEAERRYMELQVQMAQLEKEQKAGASKNSSGSRPKKSLEQEQLKAAA